MKTDPQRRKRWKSWSSVQLKIKIKYMHSLVMHEGSGRVEVNIRLSNEHVVAVIVQHMPYNCACKAVLQGNFDFKDKSCVFFCARSESRKIE